MFSHIEKVIIDINKHETPKENYCLIDKEIDVINKLFDSNNKIIYVTNSFLSDWISLLLSSWKSDIEFCYVEDTFNKDF
ncbi:MAG: hypothetical protein AB1782_15945, partial [Cyanobacteriota bacterium]